MLTPVSEVSTVELVALSPPQISPSSQLSETGSDTSTAEAPEASEASEAAGPTTESGSHADMSNANGEPGTDEDKDPKKSKAHLHCPVCKVTVNSISQLEAHNSGTRLFFFLLLFCFLKKRLFTFATDFCGSGLQIENSVYYLY